MNIVNVGYDSTNYYVIQARGSSLLVDCGWPGTLPRFLAVLKRKGIALREIRYLLVTHFHPDHAGLAQELKNQGTSFIVLECQTDFILPFAGFFRDKKPPYIPIDPNDNLVLRLADSRSFLAGIGLDGEILHTPGHSDDSVSLVLDEGSAFTGDLPPDFMSAGDLTVQTSWEAIRRHRIKKVYPGHG